MNFIVATAHPTAVVLAGGFGTRLNPVVSDRPKPLAEVCGRPFIEWLLVQVASAGFRTVVICTGHLGSMIKSALGNRYRGMHLHYSHENEPLGTGGALRNALPHIHTETMLVMNGDSYLDTDLNGFSRQHMAKGAVASIQLVQVSNAGRYGSVSIDDSGWVTGFEEKSQTAKTAWINAGRYLMARSLVATIPSNRPIALETDLFPKWLDQGVYGIKAQGKFIDIGTPRS